MRRQIVLLAVLLIALKFVPPCWGENPTNTSLVAGPAVVVTNPAPGWLSAVGKTFQVDFEQENLGSSNRLESAALVEAILAELLYANCTIYLSPHFLHAELDFYRVHAQAEPSRGTAEGILLTLEDASRSGQIDWARLAELHARASNSEAVMRNLPWLNVTPGRGRLKLASEAQAGLPLLLVKMGWLGRPTRGVVVSSSTSGSYGPPRLSNRPSASGIYYGQSMLWKIDATLLLVQSGINRAVLSYPAPAWEESYGGPSSRPLFLTRAQILSDLKSGLAETAPTRGPAKSAKKAKRAG